MQRQAITRRSALGMAAALGAAGLLSPRTASAQVKMPIMVDYFGALLNTSVVAVGQDKGWYKTPQIEVTDLVTGGGGGTAVRNMVGGNIDYGIISTSATLSAIRSGLDIRIVHSAIRTSEDLFWVAMPNSGIKSIQDLKGKKLGFTRPKSISETLAKWKLKKHGLEGQVQMVSLGAVGAGLSALESGGVDAALILEPLWSARKGRYVVAFDLSDLPPMTQMVGVASGKMIRDQPEALRALVRAWEQSVAFTYANGEEAARIIAKRYGPQTLSPDVAVSAIKSLQSIRYWSRGEIDQAGLNTWIEAMREQGEWSGPANVPAMINQSFLAPELRRS
jgi:NitT/TauT family transport system substrate-binding protein